MQSSLKYLTELVSLKDFLSKKLNCNKIHKTGSTKGN